MNRENWTIYEWNEVLKIINGKNQKDVQDINGAYPICGSGGIMGYANSYLCPENTIIIGRKGNINKPILMRQKFWNVDTAFGLVPDKNKLNYSFLYYFCVNYNFERHNKAVTIPSLTKVDLLKISIPVPPLPIQEKIVKELDTLHDILAKKKEQLKELDKLAQATFYDMFGDPVENEKGWDIGILNNVCDVRDGTHDSPKYQSEGYPLITSKNLTSGEVNFENINLISKEDFENINKRSRVDVGDILMPMIGTIGNPVVVQSSRKFAIKNVALIKFRTPSKVSNIFILNTLKSESFFIELMSKNKGGTQKFVSLGIIRGLKIPVPSLSLQNEFAAKIEAIEKQKELISLSIKDVEQLIGYTMDKYFN